MVCAKIIIIIKRIAEKRTKRAGVHERERDNSKWTERVRVGEFSMQIEVKTF